MPLSSALPSNSPFGAFREPLARPEDGLISWQYVPYQHVINEASNIPLILKYYSHEA